ncbi:hypothetical protein ABIB68_007344 [Bradyrhizobium sp. F1.2.2]
MHLDEFVCLNHHLSIGLATNNGRHYRFVVSNRNGLPCSINSSRSNSRATRVPESEVSATDVRQPSEESNAQARVDSNRARTGRFR